MNFRDKNLSRYRTIEESHNKFFSGKEITVRDIIDYHCARAGIYYSKFLNAVTDEEKTRFKYKSIQSHKKCDEALKELSSPATRMFINYLESSEQCA